MRRGRHCQLITQLNDGNQGLKVTDRKGIKRVFNAVRSFINRTDVREVIRIGAMISDQVTLVFEKPSGWKVAKAGFNIASSFMNDSIQFAENFFDGDEWCQPFSSDFNGVVLSIIADLPATTINMGGADKNVIRLVEVDGAKFGWIYSPALNRHYNVYVYADSYEVGREFIRKALWKKYSDKSVVMRRKRASFHDESTICFDIDDTFNPLTSNKAVEFTEYLRRALAAGVSRTMMFHGPPGSGKSTLARTIIKNLGLRCFRIRVEDLGHIDNSVLTEAISIFRPEAILIDDFDRVSNQSSLLEGLQTFQKTTKLVIFTVNKKSQLDEAILRPERIDEIEFIDKMDESVIMHELGEYADGFEIVKDWPIVFVREYVKQRRFKSPQDAEKAVKRLAARVKKLQKYNDEDDINYDVVADDDASDH